jgi:hypothetical protein
VAVSVAVIAPCWRVSLLGDLYKPDRGRGLRGGKDKVRSWEKWDVDDASSVSSRACILIFLRVPLPCLYTKKMDENFLGKEGKGGKGSCPYSNRR